MAHGNDAPSDGQTREDAKRAFDEAVLERLVALNAERAAEEARGFVRWLRPEFQNPAQRDGAAQTEMAVEEGEGEAAPAAAVAAPAAKPAAWPKDSIEQVRAVAAVVASAPASLSAEDIAARFTGRGPWKRRLEHVLEMLVAVGQAVEADGRYSRA